MLDHSVQIGPARRRVFMAGEQVTVDRVAIDAGEPFHSAQHSAGRDSLGAKLRRTNRRRRWAGVRRGADAVTKRQCVGNPSAASAKAGHFCATHGRIALSRAPCETHCCNRSVRNRSPTRVNVGGMI